ncbi:hypothetical protein QT972_20205 [Microcoleus sp. herbarium7]|uniref:hypothetical protein n=1 Tax=Microcoleus sp. herbarium7 TaxID=3055435 RepID=UPI002FCFFCDB
MQADIGWIEQELNEVRGDCRVLKEERDKAREKLKSSTHIINELREELLKVRSQLAAEKTHYEELDEQYDGLEEKYKELDEKYDEVVEWWKQEEKKVCDRETEIAELRSELADLKQKSATASDLSEKAGGILSFFKSLLPKNTKLPSGTISKIEKILEGSDEQRD